MPAARPPVSLWRRQAALVVALALAGCNSGASNPAGPSTTRQNLPALGNAQAPNAVANATVKRIKVTGKVVDAASGEAIEKVTILLTSEPAAQAPALPVPTPPAPGGSNPGGMPMPMGSNPGAMPLFNGSNPGAMPAPIAPGALPGPGAAPAPDVKPETYTTTSNNEGKFFFNGIPEGTMSVTFVAPKYRALTLANVDPVKLDEVSLAERNDAPRRSVKGSVTTANGSPLANAMVSPVFRPGQGFPMQVASDDKGQFLIDEITTVPKGFAALSAGANGAITAFSLVHPGDSKQEQKNWFESLFNLKGATAKPDAPVKLVTKAVTETVDLVADIEKGEGSAEGYTAKDASVFMTLNEQGDEALIARERVSSDRVQFKLPPLPGGASYHLQVRASGPDDSSSFHHVYGLRGDDKDTKIGFLPAPADAKGMVVKSDQGPTFTWDPVIGADLYRVQLDEADGETVWQGWTTKTALTYPTGKNVEKLREKDSYIWTVSAIKGLKGVSRIDAGELKGGTWSDLSITSNNDLDFNGLNKKKPSAKPASPKPSPAAEKMETKAVKPSASAKPAPAKPAPARPAAAKPPAAKPPAAKPSK